METIYDVIIVGSGPAGLTSSIYASRAGLKTLVIESYMPGGKLSKTYEIENYPAIEKISGSDLAIQLMNHGLKFGSEMEYGEVTAINNEAAEIKEVVMTDGRIFKGYTVIIATGTSEKTLDVEESEKYTGRGISYCAVCDGSFYKEKDVAVIGGGNSALEESLYLANIVNHVYIVIRRDAFRAEADIVNRVLNNPKISVITNHLPESLITADQKITGLKIRNVLNNEISELSVSGIFPYIGAYPNTSFLNPKLLDEKGYIKVNSEMETVIPGIYGAGDVIVKELRQVVTATSDGALAANSASRYLKKRH